MDAAIFFLICNIFICSFLFYKILKKVHEQEVKYQKQLMQVTRQFEQAKKILAPSEHAVHIKK